MNRWEAIKQELVESNPDALYADGYDEALAGIGRRCGQPDLAVYDANKIIDILARDMSEEEAVEFYEFNVVGAWVGPNTPVFLQTHFWEADDV